MPAAGEKQSSISFDSGVYEVGIRLQGRFVGRWVTCTFLWADSASTAQAVVVVALFSVVLNCLCMIYCIVIIIAVGEMSGKKKAPGLAIDANQAVTLTILALCIQAAKKSPSSAVASESQFLDPCLSLSSPSRPGPA